MNTVYNFYAEGVLNRFVLRIKSDEENGFFDSTRAIFYGTVFSMIVGFGLWGRRSPGSTSIIED